VRIFFFGSGRPEARSWLQPTALLTGSRSETQLSRGSGLPLSFFSFALLGDEGTRNKRWVQFSHLFISLMALSSWPPSHTRRMRRKNAE
jgi:hypothetical protein